MLDRPRLILLLLLGLALVACKDEGSPPEADQGSMDLAAGDLGPQDGQPARDRAVLDQAADLLVLDYPRPVAYWSMDDKDIEGSTLVDGAGAADGILFGTQSEPGGKVGQALLLDGASAHLDFGDVLNEVFAGPDKAFTLSMWIRPAAGAINQALLVKLADTSCDPDEDGRMFASAIGGTGTPLFVFQPLTSGGANLVASTGEPLAGGRWRQLTFVYDGSIDSSAGERVTLYLDGAAQPEQQLQGSSFPIDLQAASARLAFGVRLSAGGDPCLEDGIQRFAGAVDELAVFATALSAEEVEAIYQRGQQALRLLP